MAGLNKGPLCVCALLFAVCGGCGSQNTPSDIAVGVPATRVQEVQVVAAFPAVIDVAKGTVTRVCGKPLRDKAGQLLPGQATAAANGMELTVNFKTSAASPPLCANSGDWGLQPGSKLGPPTVTADPANTMAPGHFALQLACYEPQAGTKAPPACADPTQAATVLAKAVQFKNTVPRCDETKPQSWQNVVVIVDHSGSIAGFVLKDTAQCQTATQFAEDLPGTLKPVRDFPTCASDPHHSLVLGAQQLVESLSAKDRVLTLGFSEAQQIYASCTNDVVCWSDNFDNTGAQVVAEGVSCNSDKDCASNARAGLNFHCGPRPDQSKATVQNMSVADQMLFCFSSSATKKAFNKYGLEALSMYEASGRAATYEAVHAAYAFLKGEQLGQADPAERDKAKHIVLLTDGPDTCTFSDQFSFVQPFKPGGACRAECAFAKTRYADLLQAMAADGFPIQLHVIQIQSPGHSAPDETLQELACRTEGTFQFLATGRFDRSDWQVWSDAMLRATDKVRVALGGTWRVGFVDPSVAAQPVGQMRSLRGRMHFDSPHILDVPHGTSDFAARFEVADSQHDTRLPFRLACDSNADCGLGAGDCAVGSCTPGGLCRQIPAPDLLPCGPDGAGVCRTGKCAASCQVCVNK